MSNFEFECKECGKTFTIKLPIEDKTIASCPTCESPNLARINVPQPKSGGCGGSCGGGCNCH